MATAEMATLARVREMGDEARDNYRGLVRRMARGEPVEMPSLRQTLSLAGKSPEQLAGDVARVRERMQWAKDLATTTTPELEAARAEYQAAKAAAEALAVEFQAVEKRSIEAAWRHTHAQSGLSAESARLGKLQSAARQKFLKTYVADPEIERRQRELGDEESELANQMEPLQRQIEAATTASVLAVEYRRQISVWAAGKDFTPEPDPRGRPMKPEWAKAQTGSYDLPRVTAAAKDTAERYLKGIEAQAAPLKELTEKLADIQRRKAAIEAQCEELYARRFDPLAI